MKKEEKALLSLIQESLGLAKETMKFVNEKQRTRYIDWYLKLLKQLNEAENRWDDYNDIDIAVLQAEIVIFMKAYRHEIRSS